MQNLPRNIRQKDKVAYQDITHQGSLHYEKLYMSGKAQREGLDGYMGIPADDFNIFATAVYAFADHRDALQAIHNSGNLVRHIDIGTGPSLYMFIASLPYADELISIDLTPANVKRLTAIANKTTKIASHWHAWLEIAVILYDMGSADELVLLDRSHPNLYDKLRHWPNLNSIEKKAIREVIYTQPGTKSRHDNPYTDIDLQSKLPDKLQPRIGDVLDDVAPLADLVGTADIYTRVFFSESIDDALITVIHAETNGVQFAKEGAISISGHMSRTMGYKGFFTPQELKKHPTKKLVELPATPGFFEDVMRQIVLLSDKYRKLWEHLESEPEERKMVRQGMHYGGAVILYGTTHHKHPDGTNKYENGLELLRDSRATIRTVVLAENDTTMHCTSNELGRVVHELTDSLLLSSQSALSLSVTTPSNILAPKS